MRVGYVLKKFPRLSETFILNELLALEAAGARVEVFSLKPPDDEPRHAMLDRLRAPVTVVHPLAPRSIFRYLEQVESEAEGSERDGLKRIYGRLNAADPLNPRALAYAAALAPLVRERGIDHLHAHFATIATAAAAETAALTGRPFSFTMHAKDIYRTTVDFGLLASRLNEAAFAVTVCEANAAWLRERCGAAAGRVRVIYNGLDLERWREVPGPRQPGYLVAVGRLVEKKGFDDFLRACRIVKDAGREVSAALIGDGDDREDLLKLRETLGLEGVVEMPGAQTQEQVREALARATLVVAPCVKGGDGNSDALPTVLLEAMALGTPCVSTRVAGIPEIIDDGDQGWLVESRSPERLAEAAIDALDRPAEAARRGKLARRRAEERFDIRRNIARLHDSMAEAIGGAGAERRAAAVGAGE